VEAYNKFDEVKQQRVKGQLSGIRLMMCGSAALPGTPTPNPSSPPPPLPSPFLLSRGVPLFAEPMFHKWERISGHRLLERYGMTEVSLPSDIYRQIFVLGI